MPESDADRELTAALAAERAAYERLRELVPDLLLPAHERAPLTRSQRAEQRDYDEANERLGRAREALA